MKRENRNAKVRLGIRRIREGHGDMVSNESTKDSGRNPTFVLTSRAINNVVSGSGEGLEK